jgi:alpha-1,2-mannosyltransferase
LPKAPIIGFFHPECDGGAGGEKVLYQAIKAIQESKYNDLNILIYSGSDKKP